MSVFERKLPVYSDLLAATFKHNINLPQISQQVLETLRNSNKGDSLYLHYIISLFTYIFQVAFDETINKCQHWKKIFLIFKLQYH